MYVKAVPPTDLNRNTEWFTYPGVWTTYILIVFISWLIVLSLFSCSPGMAWTIVNLSHFLVTYHFFHWKKGTPFSDDQGIYNALTWWEQIDNGKQLTRNRKFLTVVPVVLYLIASHTTDYKNPMLFLNTLAVFVLVVAKFPNMHKVDELVPMSWNPLHPNNLYFVINCSLFIWGLPADTVCNGIVDSDSRDTGGHCCIVYPPQSYGVSTCRYRNLKAVQRALSIRTLLDTDTVGIGPLGDFVRFRKLPPKVVTYNLLSQGFRVLYSSETRAGQNGFTGIFSRSCFHREEKRSSSGLYMTKAIYTENAED
ncbi:hypothetical protein NL676_009948 [Syzygium grande]|nr:hypothetical protein NL676_009948 [Syzygium grande]